jgi:hypothetical protein
MRTRHLLLPLTLAAVLPFALASNHREAPITGLDRAADITDVYAFVSYDPNQGPSTPPEKVTLILCVDPLLEPGNGPTLFPFDPGIRYAIEVDNDHDADPDLAFVFRFSTEFQLPSVYTAAAGFENGAFQPGTTNLVVPPRIDDFGDVGLNLRQTYTVELVDYDAGSGRPVLLVAPGGGPFYAVPGNAGPRTMDYAALYAAGTYRLVNGVSVFAGTVDDPFFIDLGAAFDTANFRTLETGTPGVLSASEDAASTNAASDTVSGYAVNAIALEVPIEMLTAAGQLEPPSSPFATIGVIGSTSRPRITVRRSPDPLRSGGGFRQVQRMGNPLINELLIGLGSKDRFSMDRPKNDQQFAGFFLDPPIVGIVEALYGGALAVPAAPRTDLLPLVTYAAPIAAPLTPAGPVADMLRLNTGVPATPPAQASRLGLIGGDAAGYPNGRRLADDVVDITLRVAIGGVLAPGFAGFDPNVNGRLGDGVNVNDAPFADAFPYLGLAPDGRNRRHIDPGEPGGGPVN